MVEVGQVRHKLAEVAERLGRQRGGDPLLAFLLADPARYVVLQQPGHSVITVGI
jgi:hypothetical protein